jgi:uncharacterized protein (TIGR00106 family)
MAMAQVSIVPLGTGSTSLSGYVAEVARWLEDNRVPHRLTPMGTVIEGEVPDLLSIIGRIHELPFQAGASRVMTLISLDDRRDRAATAQGKLDSVAARLKEGKIA